MEPLRFGIISTASINSYGFLPIVGKVADAELVAVASRSEEAAAKYAAKHGIPYAYGSYEGLLASSGIDCVYIPLPVSMHAEWAIKALEAGKHVMCEKPLTASAEEAEAIRKKVKETKLTFIEAFHYRYHPLMLRVGELVRSGAIGEVRKVSSAFCILLPDPRKVQFKPELAGGALLDVGCYPVSFVRWIAGSDNARVERARAFLAPSGVDLTTSAVLRFDNGVIGRINCSLIVPRLQTATVVGTEGSIEVHFPFSPVAEVGPLHLNLYRLTLKNKKGKRNIRVASDVTYYYQLKAFCRAVRTGEPALTNIDEAVANMRLIEAIIKKAGISTGPHA
ncbi:MAG: Gfo/Idh/MocA family oxidoreductase [bacterium]